MAIPDADPLPSSMPATLVPEDPGALQKEKALSGFSIQNLFSSKDSLEKIIREELARTESRNMKKEPAKVLVDAETITVYSEPSLFTCSTCKSVYSSSWFLIQHVQKAHGLCIYVEPSSSSKDGGGGGINGRVADLVVSLTDVDDDPTSPSTTGGGHHPSSQTSSPVLSKSEMFCQQQQQQQPTTASFLTGSQQRGAAAQWKSTFNLPVHQNSNELSMVHRADLMTRLAAGLPFRPVDLALPDIYSQRLRHLAGQPSGAATTSTTSNNNNTTKTSSSSPPAATSTSPVVNTNKKQPPSSLTSSDAPSAFSAPPSTKKGGGTEDKGYSCPVCSKQFRFGVTLNVHQRSHTGETPFKCPLCAQSFSLASKLKRHLVTQHKFLALANLDSNTRSSTPESKEDDYLEGSDEDSDPPDTQEFALQETQAEAELIMASRHELSASTLLAEELRGSFDPSARENNNTSSVLSELMKGSGMDKIPEYKEAFRAALDELSDNDDRSEEEGSNSLSQQEAAAAMDSPASEITENSIKEEESRDGSSSGTPNHHHRRRRPSSSQSRDNSPVPAKFIKLETTQVEDKGGGHPSAAPAVSMYSNLESLYPREIRDAATMAAVAQVGMYPNIWFQPSRDFLPFPRGSIFATTTRENGLATTPTTTTQSALKVSQSTNKMVGDSGGGGGGTRSTPSKSPTGSSSMSGGGQQAPIRRRNDTCEYCGKIFKNCSNLTVHRRSHTGEKPYKCQLCSYACAQSSKLTRHMRTHGRMGKDVYKCKFCEMPFSVPSTLEKHMRKCMENHPSMSPPNNLSPPLASLNLSSKAALEVVGGQADNTAAVSLLGNMGLSKALDFGVGLGCFGGSKGLDIKLEPGIPYNGLDLSRPVDLGVVKVGKSPSPDRTKEEENMVAYNGLDLSKSLGGGMIAVSPKLSPPQQDDISGAPYNGMNLTVKRQEEERSTGDGKAFNNSTNLTVEWGERGTDEDRETIGNGMDLTVESPPPGVGKDGNDGQMCNNSRDLTLKLPLGGGGGVAKDDNNTGEEGDGGQSSDNDDKDEVDVLSPDGASSPRESGGDSNNKQGIEEDREDTQNGDQTQSNNSSENSNDPIGVL